jgi:SAM-dependent methyltransferase
MSETRGPRRGIFRELAQRFLSAETRRRASKRYRRLRAWPPVRFGRLGMGRLVPVSRAFGFERGEPIDRHYIDDFMRRHARPGVVQGDVLEIGEPLYARRYGYHNRLGRIEILDVSPTNPQATVVADLSDAPELDSESFDCVICTQTLHLIYDVRSAVQTLHRILKPAGALLVTLPGITQICHSETESWGDYWRFTDLSARRLFEEFFDPSDVALETYGNVFTAAAFLYGLATKDLRPSQLEARDPDYQVLIAIKAVKDPGTR